jgi:hypothetical protein
VTSQNSEKSTIYTLSVQPLYQTSLLLYLSVTRYLVYGLLGMSLQLSRKVAKLGIKTVFIASTMFETSLLLVTFSTLPKLLNASLLSGTGLLLTLDVTLN